MNTKQCTKCLIIKEYKEFQNDVRYKTGVKSQCRKCVYQTGYKAKKKSRKRYNQIKNNDNIFKECSLCKESKQLKEFHLHNSKCKKCTNFIAILSPEVPPSEKQCCRCNKIKKIEAFCHRSTLKTGYTGHCKDCENKAAKEYYYKNKDSRKATIKRNIRKYNKNRKDIITQAKSVPCVDCGSILPVECMDFDHIPEKGEKLFNLASAIFEKRRYDEIYAEIAKCEVVCANCHRVRTSKRCNERKSV